MAGALEVLPRAVDHDRDAAEVLQAADVDRGLRRVGALAEPDARQAEEQVRGALRLELVDLLLAHRAHHRERIDGLLDRLGGEHRDRIERRLRARGDMPAATISARKRNFTERSATAPLQPPMTAPVTRLECPGWRATAVARACWLALSAPFWRVFASVAFVNDMYYACQGSEIQVKTTLNYEYSQFIITSK